MSNSSAQSSLLSGHNKLGQAGPIPNDKDVETTAELPAARCFEDREVGEDGIL